MKLEDRLKELRGLRRVEPGEALDTALRRALNDRSNLIVAEAAKVVIHHRRVSLVADLLAAFERFFENPAKTDSKCWAKTAIVKTLTALEYIESPPFLRALTHIQMEPVLGGQEDAAVLLRGNAVLGLVTCSDLTRGEILRYLVDALADPQTPVRIEAVRSLEQMNGEESCLVLRSKALSGDQEPEVLGQVFDSILRLEGERGVPFVEKFMAGTSAEVRDESALALGGSRLPSAVKTLLGRWNESRQGEFGSVLLRALSSSRDETALDFLLTLVREGSPRDSASAIEALQLHSDSAEILERIEQAKKAR